MSAVVAYFLLVGGAIALAYALFFTFRAIKLI
ncbi:cytochrome b6-f complex subunit PetL [Leptolyngbya sp. NIES-2104]|nr:cytochrome b6-f complex subunit PetL [Leptolyngbya sp. NIES-2104]